MCQARCSNMGLLRGTHSAGALARSPCATSRPARRCRGSARGEPAAAGPASRDGGAVRAVRGRPGKASEPASRAEARYRSDGEGRRRVPHEEAGGEDAQEKAPSPATLDKEVELLKRMLNYAVACGSLASNPLGAVKLLRKPNVRRSVLDDTRPSNGSSPPPRISSSRPSWWRMFRRACTAAKLRGVWLHDLRRSFVTNARRRGVPESVVMKMSGHRTRAVFDRYNIIEEDDLREAVKRLEAGVAKRSGGSGQDLDKVDGKGA